MTQVPADGGNAYPEEQYPLQALNSQIIAAFFSVYNTFGFGYKESAYRRSLAVELDYVGLRVAQEVPFELQYRGVVVGSYRAALVVASSVVVEAKTGLTLDPAWQVQLLNYLKVSRLPVGLVLHFGPRPTIKRIIASTRRVDNL
jgi:GxxExxY protein